MSFFGVTVEQISELKKHPNADRLMLAKLEGMEFQFCVPTDQYEVGDLVLYFPIDAVIPQEVLQRLGLEGKLAGKDKNRLKTVRLRGEISQGIVATVESLLGDQLPNLSVVKGTDYTEYLGVVKYEPPEAISGFGSRGSRPEYLRPLPQLVEVYDIEGAERNPEIVELLMDQSVMVTEKVEGSHFSASLYKDGDFAICQRRFRLVPNEDEKHEWHYLAEKQNIRVVLESLFALTEANHVVTLRGEVVGPGIQGNIYGFTERRIVFFEIERDGLPVDVVTTHYYFTLLDVESVPVLYQGTLRSFLDGESIVEESHGATLLMGAKSTLREGIVIRPIKEQWDMKFGRVILKQRDPIYLEKSDL